MTGNKRCLGMHSPRRSRACCGLAGLAQVELSLAQGAQPRVLPAWEGWVPGNSCARPRGGAVQGAQPAPLTPKEQILGICPLDAVRAELSLCLHLLSDASCVYCSTGGIAKIAE